ncbi:MAG: MGMT family protein, partial [Pseudomonas aeruginosa]
AEPVPLMSDNWRKRVLQVVRQIPEGRWVTYGQLAEVVGVAPGYCRAFPRLLAGIPEGARAQPASAAQRLPAPWDASGLFERLPGA